jgi:hypothetical protein
MTEVVVVLSPAMVVVAANVVGVVAVVEAVVVGGVVNVVVGAVVVVTGSSARTSKVVSEQVKPLNATSWHPWISYVPGSAESGMVVRIEKLPVTRPSGTAVPRSSQPG